MTSRMRARDIAERLNSGPLLSKTNDSSGRTYCSVDRPKYNWRAEFDDYVKAHLQGWIQLSFPDPQPDDSNHRRAAVVHQAPGSTRGFDHAHGPEALDPRRA